MNSKIIILLLSFLAIVSCRKGGKSYVYKGVNMPAIVTLFPDSSFIREEKTKDCVARYHGQWCFINQVDSLISLTTTGQGSQIWTLTPIETFRIAGDTLIEQ